MMGNERLITHQVEDTLPDVHMTFVRCESQRNVHVFIPEAFFMMKYCKGSGSA